MSATEIIEQIKALPPEEQARVVEFVSTLNGEPPVRYMDEKTFQAAVDKVFAEHHEVLRKLAS